MTSTLARCTRAVAPILCAVLAAAPLRALPEHALRHEARALWVSRFDYSSAAGIEEIMRIAARAHFNLVYFQARAAADAYYASDIEPCAARLCGRLGGTLPYDPLEVAVAAAHRNGLQLHAWLNALTGLEAGNAITCARLATAAPDGPRPALIEHPEWAMVDRGGRGMACPNSEEYIWLSPGFPEVRTRLAAVAADIARRYDIDGIHLDRIRYPGSDWSYDSLSLAAFGENPERQHEGWSQFRAGLVQATVEETLDSLVTVNPKLVLSAAVWGVYDDRWNWRTQSGRRDLFQDPRAWSAARLIDVVVPMTYVRIGPHRCSRTDWVCLVRDHVAGIQKRTGRPVYAGINAELGAAEVVRQIRLARSAGATGVAIFSYGAAANRPEIWRALARGPFAEKAILPPVASVRARTVARGQ